MEKLRRAASVRRRAPFRRHRPPVRTAKRQAERPPPETVSRVYYGAWYSRSRSACPIGSVNRPPLFLNYGAAALDLIIGDAGLDRSRVEFTSVLLSFFFGLLHGLLAGQFDFGEF